MSASLVKSVLSLLSSLSWLSALSSSFSRSWFTVAGRNRPLGGKRLLPGLVLVPGRVEGAWGVNAGR